MSRKVWRPIVEVAFIMFLFKSNLLMGEFERANSAGGKSVAAALADIFTGANFVIGISASLIGYAVFKALAQRLVGSRMADIGVLVQDFTGPTPDLLRLVLNRVGSIVSTGDVVVLPRMVLAEAGNFPELAQTWRREVVDRGLGLWEAILRRGQARGEFRAIEPAHAARLCIAPLIIVALWRSVFSQFDAAPYDYQGLIDAHIDVLLRGLTPEPPT